MCQKFEEISGNTVENFSDVSLRFKTLAAELYNMNSKISFIYNQIFPDTAQGEYLDKQCEMRNISRKAATKAVGTLRFYVDEPLNYSVNIPKGTVCTTGGENKYQYTTDSAVTLKSGTSFVDAKATAVEAGPEYNCTSNKITLIVNPPSGISKVKNPTSFGGGSKQESDDELRKRLMNTMRNFPNGYNAASVRDYILSNPSISKVQVVPLANGVGTLSAYVTTKSGLAETAVLNGIREGLTDILPLCTQVEVTLAKTAVITPIIELKINSGANSQQITETATQVVTDYISGLDIGENLYANRLGVKLLEIEGVENYTFNANVYLINNGCQAKPGTPKITTAAWEG